MKYEEFIQNVAQAEGIGSKEKAEEVAHTALKVLGSRLQEGEAHDLASQLPPELGDAVRTGAASMQKLSVDEFVGRVGREAGIDDQAEAERYVRAVIGTMSEAVTRGELTDVFSQLPSEYQDLFTARSV